MYAGPKSLPLPASALRGHDPFVEAELSAWAHAHCEEDEAAFDREDATEFLAAGSTPRERHERAWDRMEDDVDYHYERAIR